MGLGFPRPVKPAHTSFSGLKLLKLFQIVSFNRALWDSLEIRRISLFFFILYFIDHARIRLRGGGASYANFVDIFLYQIIKISLTILKSN